MFLKFISWYIAHLFLLVCSFQMYFHSLFDHSIVNLLFSCSVVSNSLWPHGLQHTRLCYASPSPKTCSNSCPLSEWYHPNISSSVIPFSSCLQSFPTSGSFPVSWFFAPCGQSIGASASASVLPINSGLISFKIDWFDFLAVQGSQKSLLQHHSSKASILRHSAFFMCQLLLGFWIVLMNNASICTFICLLGLPQWLSSKESACGAGDTGDTNSIPGSVSSPAERNGNLLQYSCLKKSHGQRSLIGYSPKVPKRWTGLSN